MIYIKNQEDAIKHFISKMDTEMLEAILDSKNTYQNMEKDKFLLKLERVFQVFKESGDTYLSDYKGKCNKCYKEKGGFTFVGNISKNYVSLIIDTLNGTVIDMFECTNFKNNDESIVLKSRIYIDDFSPESLFKLIE
jgi:hypothetical protein